MDELENLVCEMFYHYGAMSDIVLYEKIAEDYPATKEQVVEARRSLVRSGLVEQRRDRIAHNPQTGVPVAVWSLVKGKSNGNTLEPDDEVREYEQRSDAYHRRLRRQNNQLDDENPE